MPEPAYQQGEALQWITIENGFPAKRMVSYHQPANEHSAIVKFGGNQYTANLSDLSRPQPPEKPWFLPAPFVVKPPPTPASESQLAERLATARAALSHAHQHVIDIQQRLEDAKAVSLRAANELNTARAALNVYNQHARRDQIELEESLRLGKPIPQLSNGADRHLIDRTSRAEAAKAKFDAELAACNAALSEALETVRSRANEIVSLLVQIDVEHLRRMETQAAISRAQLLAVASHWFAGAALGPIKLPPATSQYLELQPQFNDVPEVRRGGPEGRTRPYREIFDRLVQGDIEADFRLEKD
jgi:hypothetical protein